MLKCLARDYQNLERETTTVSTVPDGEPVFSTMLLVDTPPAPRRLSAFTGSVLLHTILIVLMASWSVNPPGPGSSSVKPRYSVRFLQLAPLQAYRKRVTPGPARTGAAQTKSAGLPSLQARLQDPAPAASGGSEAHPAAETPIKQEHRRFELPPTSRVDQVKQTLVQLDLPPNLVMKQEIPLPTAVLWTETEPAPPMRKPFVAPTVKEVPKVVERLPKAPLLERPNLETNVRDLNMASTILTDTPHLVQPPGIASPVSSAGQEPAKEIPRLHVADSSNPSAANVISLPTNPSQTARLLVLPPVNQIAPGDAGNAGSLAAPGAGGADKSHGSGAQGLGVSASSPGVLGGTTAGIAAVGSGAPGGRNSSPESNGSGNKPGSGGGAATSGKEASGTASSGTSANGSGTAGSAGVPGALAGVTRITLPKDGKFGVVVLGSAGSTPYPESVGALGGKVVYTVYLKVGLRKSWILQYCLPKTKTGGQGAVNGTSATTLAAPWPFLILRPDQLADSDTDYIIVHGMLNSAGQFDQLAMVFPAELDKRDLLLKSLKLWAFRPASRDGEPVAVEVLLIIPREDG